MAKQASELDRKVLQNLRTSGDNQHIFDAPLKNIAAEGEIIVQMGTGLSADAKAINTGLWTLASDGETPVRFPSEQRVQEMISSGAVAEVDAIEAAVGLQSDGTIISGNSSVWGSDSKYFNSGSTVVNAVKQLDTNLYALSGYVVESDYEKLKEDNSILVALKQVDGRVSADTALISTVKLSGYTEVATPEHVAETDTLGQALGKLQGQIDGMNKDADAQTGHIVTTVSEVSGVVEETKALLTDIIISGYTEGGNAKVAVTDKLGAALGKLQGQINAMDKSADAQTGHIVTTVSEEDGKVSETKALLKDIVLSGYTKSNGIGAIDASDTVNEALSKLENQIGKNTITNADGSINVVTTGPTTDINVNIKSGEKVLAKDGNGGLYTDLDLVKITEGLPETVKERYQLLATDNSQLGVNIDIYKDSHIVSISFISDPSDEHYQNLEYVYIDARGVTQTTYVDVSQLVLEAEFASGVSVTNHIVHGVVDETSEAFLTVGADGFKLSGVQDAINNKVNALNADVTGTSTDNHVKVEVKEVSGVVTNVVVTTTDIASAQGLANEIARATSAETQLDAVIGTETGASESRTYTHAGTNYLNNNTTVKADAETIDGLLGKVSDQGSANTEFTTTETVAKNITDIKKDIDAFKHKLSLSGLENNYAKVTVVSADTGTTIEVSAKTHTISTATALEDGLADAYDVKQFAVNGVLTDTSAGLYDKSAHVVVNTDAQGIRTLDFSKISIDCGTF